MSPTGPVITFDLFSALLDSRAGGSEAFGRMAADRRWRVRGEDLYDHWDARNKQAQRECAGWVPYADLAGAALAATYRCYELDGDPDADVAVLLETLPDWPLWPDAAAGLTALRHSYRVGILSNVDDDLLARTRAGGLVEPELALTSERLRAYKPGRRIYQRAREMLGPMVHVATSARDVRGALEAGLPVVRLRRPGHGLDHEGPRPPYEAGDILELQGLLEELLGRAQTTPTFPGPVSMGIAAREVEPMSDEQSERESAEAGPAEDGPRERVADFQPEHLSTEDAVSTGGTAVTDPASGDPASPAG